MKYQVIYGKGPLSTGFDTLAEAIGFAERHQTLTDAPAVWEHTDGGCCMVWPTTDQAAYIAERYSTPRRTGPITLADAMTRAGVSVQKLAKETGISYQQIYRIRSGEIRLANTTARNAMCLAEALGVDIRDLLAGETARGEVSE